MGTLRNLERIRDNRTAREIKRQTKLLEELGRIQQQAPQQPPMPEGWYADPQRPGWLRRWDGVGWTNEVAQIQEP
jgi:hypothetical protein